MYRHMMDVGPAWAMCLFVAASSTSFGGADILEQWIHPLTRDAFFNEFFEKTWAHFPHPESLVPISLDHVAEWIREQGSSNEVVETLRHPVTQKSFRPSSKLDSLQHVSEAFLQGFSMVINSLHKWSEPGARLAKQLYAAGDFPVDVYMYLTPPHSYSYGVHSDVMDAFMVQLSGQKLWSVCDVPSWMFPGRPPQSILDSSDVSCVNVTLQGGDVMYLPFGTLHQASTGEDFSMHLTVNLERQFYVWHALLLAMIHKAFRPGLRIKKFASSEDFLPDELDIPLVRLLSNLAASVPELYRLPGFSFVNGSTDSTARLLLQSLCNQDLPERYLDQVTAEFQDLVVRLESVAAAGNFDNVLIGSRSVAIMHALDLIKRSTVPVLPWALQLARFHAMKHFSLLGKPHQLLSLSAARSRDPGALTKLPLSKFASVLSSEDTLVRAPVRAVLLEESETPEVLKLVVNGASLSIQKAEVPAALFCLGRFAKTTSKGRPFKLSDVPGDSSKLIPKLLSSGALQLL